MGGRIDGQNDGQYERDGSENENNKNNDIKASMLALSTLGAFFWRLNTKVGKKKLFLPKGWFHIYILKAIPRVSPEPV